MAPPHPRQRIKLRQLEVLCVVAACGTMGRAAERLATTQPVISKAIAELERAVFEEQQIVVAGACTKWAKRRSIKLSDLLNERWVLPSTDSAGGMHVTEVFRTCSLPLPPITVFSTSIQLYNALVARGSFLAM